MSRRRKTRRNCRRRQKSSPVWRLLIAVLSLTVIGVFSIIALFLYYGLDPKLPQIDGIEDYRPLSTTRIYDRRGRLIGELASQRRTVVPMKRIPKLLVQAVVATEDAGFFEHGGLDYLGVVRALWANLRAGRFVQGGSTITQQTVKTFFLTPARTIRRKVQEVILAWRLESRLSKEEILHLYLNQIYFGHGRYGVEAASHYYFDKGVDKLRLAEIAILAGLPQGPERLSPIKHPKRAKKRQRYVLRAMARRKYISNDVAKRVGGQPLPLTRVRPPFLGVAPEVTDRVEAELIRRFGRDAMATLGVEVHTTIDAELQRMARASLRRGLQSIDQRHGYQRAVRPLKDAARRRMLARLARKQSRIVPGQTLRGVVVAIKAEAQQAVVVDVGGRQVTVDVSASRYNPQRKSAAERFRVGALMRLRAISAKRFVFDGGPQGAMIVLDPRSGDVLAMIGGFAARRGDFNRALRAVRQPGSAFKPFVYGAALASERYTPATIVEDAPAVYKGWEPRNFDGKYRGQLRLRDALAHSINTVSAKLLDGVGLSAVRQLARSLGIGTDLGKEQDLSLALGAYGVKLIDLAVAYAAIANGGQRRTPRLISRIDNKPMPAAEPKAVLLPEVAYVLTSMMQSVVNDGTAQRAKRLGRPWPARRAPPTIPSTLGLPASCRR